MIDLTSRIALVTGAGAGIGEAIATAFGSLGARVAAIDVDAGRAAALESSLSSAGVDALIVTGDAADAGVVDAAMTFDLAWTADQERFRTEARTWLVDAVDDWRRRIGEPIVSGDTIEYDLQLALKRTWALSRSWGDPAAPPPHRCRPRTRPAAG